MVQRALIVGVPLVAWLALASSCSRADKPSPAPPAAESSAKPFGEPVAQPKTAASAQQQPGAPTKKPIKRRMSEAEEKAKIAALLGAGPGKLTDPSKARPTAPTTVNPATVSQVVIGTAKNAKLGAVVDSKDGVFYVDGLDQWPDDMLDKTVQVTGKVARKALSPSPTVGPNGERSTGAAGSQRVLLSATWKLATATP